MQSQFLRKNRTLLQNSPKNVDASTTLCYSVFGYRLSVFSYNKVLLDKNRLTLTARQTERVFVENPGECHTAFIPLIYQQLTTINGGKLCH